MEHATTLNLPTPAARHDARVVLADAVAAFLAAGGEVDELEGFDPAPRPARREPIATAPLKRRRKDGEDLISCRGTVVRKNLKQATAAYERRRELAERIQRYASMGCIACASMVGVSPCNVRSVAKQFGITLGRSR